MTLAWTPTRDALTSALATASSADRGAILAARSELESLGARYDAAVTAGTIAPGASDPAAVVASQRAAVTSALLRAARFAEGLPGVQPWTGPEERSPAPEMREAYALRRAGRTLSRVFEGENTGDPRFTIARERITTHMAALRDPAPADAGATLERSLAAALQRAAALLAYLGTP